MALGVVQQIYLYATVSILGRVPNTACAAEIIHCHRDGMEASSGKVRSCRLDYLCGGLADKQVQIGYRHGCIGWLAVQQRK